MLLLPDKITAYVFRSTVVGGDPDRVVGVNPLAVTLGRVETGYVSENGFVLQEVLTKPKQIKQAELDGCEFGYTKLGDYGAWVDGQPYKYNDSEQKWPWTKESYLFFAAVYWDIPFDQPV